MTHGDDQRPFESLDDSNARAEEEAQRDRPFDPFNDNPDDDRGQRAPADPPPRPKPRGNRSDPPKPGRRVRFKLVSLDELKLDRSGNYVVKGLIPRTGLVVIWGPPKCGKSFKTMDMLLHVALGWQYRGRRVKQGFIVYCALEGQSGFPARTEAFYAHHGDGVAEAAVKAFRLMFTPLNLIKDYKELIRDIEAQLPDGVVPIAIAIDTLNRTLAGSESKDEDMSAYVQAADALRDHFGCVVVIVHHCGVDGTRPRGHTSLAGADDVQLAVSRDETKNIVLTVEHAKDGPEGEIITSKLEVVDLGPDDDGDSITSCVVVPVEVEPDAEAAAKPAAASRQKLKGRYKIGLDALTEVLVEYGTKCGPNIAPPGTQVVTEDQWKAELAKKGLIKPEDPKHAQTRYEEIRDALHGTHHMIGVNVPFVWLERCPTQSDKQPSE
jgi:hypothetical protein